MSTTTTSYVIDSWAWIEYFRSTKHGLTAKGIIEGGGNVFTSALTISEVLSKFARMGMDVDDAYIAINTLSRIIEIDAVLARDAGILHSKIKKESPNFGLVDAFVLQTAMALGAKVLTGDPDFKGLRGVEMLK
jgi:predicted nucleic acid-binding protein